MRYLIIIYLVVASFQTSAQNRFNFNQYMLNQATFNPGFNDIHTRLGGTFIGKKQWMTGVETPVSLQANGYYQLSKNHGLSGLIMQDRVGQFNTMELSTNYTYHAYLNKTTALGFGLKMGFESRFIDNSFVYFEEYEPSLSRTYKGALQMGAGTSIQSQNFEFGLSFPHFFNNTLPNAKKTYDFGFNTFYSHIGYKIRPSDYFVVYPSALVRGVQGSKPGISLDLHFLANETFWFGGGYRSDNTVSLTAGVFLNKGLRIIYNYESAFFSPHKRLDLSHEITLNFARSLQDNPFSRMKYFRKGKSGKLRKKIRR